MLLEDGDCLAGGRLDEHGELRAGRVMRRAQRTHSYLSKEELDEASVGCCRLTLSKNKSEINSKQGDRRREAPRPTQGRSYQLN